LTGGGGPQPRNFAEITLRPWADLVFHVLAHVRATRAIPASVHDPAYVAAVAAELGPASERPLAADAVVLGRVLATHELLARAQLLAWLFQGLDRARAVAGVDLADLAASDVDEPSVLAELCELGPAVEVLRCACELERPLFERLAVPSFDPAPVLGALAGAAGLAPALASCRFGVVRSLRLRGRVRGREIWFGLPDLDGEPSLLHVTWQASHEATVLELLEAARLSGLAVAERELEHAALVLLAERAERSGKERDHAQWFAHFGARAPPLARAALAENARRLLEA